MLDLGRTRRGGHQVPGIARNQIRSVSLTVTCPRTPGSVQSRTSPSTPVRGRLSSGPERRWRTRSRRRQIRRSALAIEDLSDARGRDRHAPIAVAIPEGAADSRHHFDYRCARLNVDAGRPSSFCASESPAAENRTGRSVALASDTFGCPDCSCYRGRTGGCNGSEVGTAAEVVAVVDPDGADGDAVRGRPAAPLVRRSPTP
jgi:hypothetical protein